MAAAVIKDASFTILLATDSLRSNICVCSNDKVLMIAGPYWQNSTIHEVHHVMGHGIHSSITFRSKLFWHAVVSLGLRGRLCSWRSIDKQLLLFVVGRTPLLLVGVVHTEH